MTEPPAASASRPKAGRNLPVAIASGAVLLAWLFGTLLWWQWGFIVFLVVAVVAGSYEVTNALNKAQLHAAFAPIAVGGPVTIVLAHLLATSAGQLAGAGIILAGLTMMVIACLVARLNGPVRGYLGDVSASLFTIGYLPLLLAPLTLLLAQPQGNLRVIFYFILVPVCDTGAYAFGSWFGKHKMAPHISPGKTWEGLAGGVLTAGVAGALIGPALIGAQWWAGAIIGVALGLAGSVGDLIESMIKRDVGLKDMSQLIPGHGGAMDRLDSLLVAAPIAWISMLVLVR